MSETYGDPVGIGPWARARPEDGALIDEARSVMSFGTLDERQRRLAGLLRDAGIERGDRIAIAAGNQPVVIEITAGALRAGVIPVPINPLLTAPEIEYILDDSGARCLFTGEPVELRPNLELVVLLGDAYERALASSDPADIAPCTLTRPMHYTSGTTGAPKGVHLTPADTEEAADRARRFIETWGLVPDDVHLVCSPLAHSAPLRFAIRTLEAGGTVVVLRRFDPIAALAAIDLFGVTTTFMVPTHLQRILALGSDKIARFDLSTLRVLAHAGARIATTTKRRVLETFPQGCVWEFYGSTEGQATRISTEEWLAKPGSVGRAYEGAKIYILSDELESVPRGEVGRVWVLDPTAEEFSYFGDPDKTEAAWEDGAFHVGDLGYLDDDGYLFLVGRADDTIITGGVNVYPAEVEEVLAAHPAVEAVLVYGAKSKEWGQEVRAKIVPVSRDAFDTAALRDWAKERLAAFKIPKRFDVVTRLPATPTGKPRRPKSRS